MKLTKEKKEAFGILALGLLLHVIAQQYITSNSNGYYEGPGLIIGLFGFIIWVYGMIKYARTKGRSDLLALILSVFWLLGLLILVLLHDTRRPKSRKSAK